MSRVAGQTCSLFFRSATNTDTLQLARVRLKIFVISSLTLRRYIIPQTPFGGAFMEL